MSACDTTENAAVRAAEKRSTSNEPLHKHPLSPGMYDAICRASYEGLVRIFESTAWSSDSSTVYENMVDAVVVAFSCDEVHLHLFDVENNRFVKCASHGEAEVQNRNTVGLDVGRMRWMVETRQPIVMDYIHPYQQDMIPPIGHEAGFVSAVNVPLVSKEEVLGMCFSCLRTHAISLRTFCFSLGRWGEFLVLPLTGCVPRKRTSSCRYSTSVSS